MMRTSSYAVVVYSADTCTFHNPNKANDWLDLLTSTNDPPPDLSRLTSIQQTLLLDRTPNSSRVLVLVPDSWLSVSKHLVDHVIPSSLLPLAALSYAVEATFAPPETLMFHYHQDVLSPKRVELTVFACSAEWAEQLCLPFQPLAKSCLLMSQSQWIGIQSSQRSWSHCSQQAVSFYLPDKEKKQKMRRLWRGLLVLSVSLHSAAAIYFFSLQGESNQALMNRQQRLISQSTWLSAQAFNGMAEPILTLIQALPDSVRLGRFSGEPQSAFFQLTLSTQELERLLGYWRKQYPHWQWDVEQQPHSLSSMTTQEEVVDASIKVFQK